MEKNKAKKGNKKCQGKEDDVDLKGQSEKVSMSECHLRKGLTEVRERKACEYAGNRFLGRACGPVQLQGNERR